MGQGCEATVVRCPDVPPRTHFAPTSHPAVILPCHPMHTQQPTFEKA